MFNMHPWRNTHRIVFFSFFYIFVVLCVYYRSVEPSGNYTAIIPVSDVGVPEAVVLDWDYQSSVVNPFSWRIVAPRVYIEYIKVESLDFNLRFVDFEQMSNFHKKKNNIFI